MKKSRVVSKRVIDLGKRKPVELDRFSGAPSKSAWCEGLTATGRTPSVPNLQSNSPRTEMGKSIREAAAKYRMHPPTKDRDEDRAATKAKHLIGELAEVARRRVMRIVDLYTYNNFGSAVDRQAFRKAFIETLIETLEAENGK